jgi:tRNA threonylcarbamoyl adenosine modification protein YeaZ
MVILAMETVTPQGSWAAWRDGVCRSGTGDSRLPHAGRLPASWQNALAAVDATLDDVSRLVVVAGPGSFTGVRIGIASAQGLALTRGWSVTPVPTLDAMAECWRAAHRGDPPRTVLACLDGSRGEVFVREFRFDGEALQPIGDAMVAAPADVRWTPNSGGVSMIGNGAVRYADQWSEESDDIHDVPEPIAAGAARLAAADGWPAVAPHALRPLYVRRPDVELARERGRVVVR